MKDNLIKLGLLSVIIGICLLVYSFAPTDKNPVKETKKYFITSVCSSASESKIVLDAYFKNGWQLESITSQSIEVNVPRSRFDLYGGNISREYLIIVSKIQ